MRHDELMVKYCVPSMGDHTAVGGPIIAILERLDSTGGLSDDDLQFLRDKGLFALCGFVERMRVSGRADFGILRGPVDRRARLNEERELRRRYEIDYFEYEDKRRLLGILRTADRGARLSDDDVVWLKERELFTDALRRVFHEHEAAHHQKRFERSGDPWEAVNASSHFRKAGRPADALTVLGRVPPDANKDMHLQSALCTTRGGALRDLGRLQEARESALQGHESDTRRFHPCTLLGAVHYELEEFSEGDAWFAKAVERGAKRDSIDQELRAILRRTSGERREALTMHLLALDPDAYAWAMDFGKRRAGIRPHRESRRK